ncbi:MAG: SBBP repeat-containing protein, partial [Chromatiaceae bacterium]
MIGSFSGKATFAAGEPNETVLVSDLNATLADAFVAKYGPDGSFLWAKQSAGDGGTGDSHHICASSVYARGIAVDRAGNSLVTGDFSITATFGAGERNETALDAGSCGGGMFLAKYAPDGSLLWAKQSFGGGSGRAVAVDTAGNSLVTGEFYDTVTFGAGEPKEAVLTAVGSFGDIFLAKYAPDGSLVWAKRAAGSAAGDIPSLRVFGIATDAAGDSLLTGGFSGTVTLGAGAPNETTFEAHLGSSVYVAVFLAKYAPDGSFLWAKQS